MGISIASLQLIYCDAVAGDIISALGKWSLPNATKTVEWGQWKKKLFEKFPLAFPRDNRKLSIQLGFQVAGAACRVKSSTRNLVTAAELKIHSVYKTYIVGRFDSR